MRSFGAQRGFTLVELMAVVSIMGAIMLIAVPTIRTFTDQHKLQASVATLESGLRKARSSAITKNCNVRVWVFDDTNSYVIARDTEGNGAYVNMLATGALDPTVSVANLAFNGADFITFDSRGRPDNSGSIRLKSKAGRLREIRVSPGSGTISITTPDN